MPLYDYRCTSCGKITEIRHGFNDNHAEPCAACGAPVARVFNPAPIVFKGSGFYVTDSRKGGGRSDAPAPTPAPKSDSGSAPAPATESKSSEPAA